MKKRTDPGTKVALFEQRTIRREWFNDEWWFSIIDVVEVLTGTDRPRKYWNDLKKKLNSEGYVQVSEKIGQLKMTSADGKKYLTDAANTETLLRIIQSIPSPKAEPFKRWLAQVGNERILEINDPELAMERMKTLYEAKGYPKEWIEQRIRGIEIRRELTDEWKDRGAEEKRDYAILTNEITRATFGMDVQDYKEYKGLARENLRDHMTNLELVLTMLGEATTTELHRNRDSLGVPELKRDARDGGEIAGNTRREIEQKTGKSIVSPESYRDVKRLKGK
jgi:hypothetical protein